MQIHFPDSSAKTSRNYNVWDVLTSLAQRIFSQQGPPPHFRRWMQKFMRRWHNRNIPCWNEEGSEAQKDKKAEGQAMDQGTEGTEGAESSGESSGEEFLKNVGETMAEMLNPYGK